MLKRTEYALKKENEKIYKELLSSPEKKVYTSFGNMPEVSWMFWYTEGKTEHVWIENMCHTCFYNKSNYIITDDSLNILITSGSDYPVPYVNGRVGLIGSLIIDMETKCIYDAIDIIYDPYKKDWDSWLYDAMPTPYDRKEDWENWYALKENLPESEKQRKEFTVLAKKVWRQRGHNDLLRYAKKKEPDKISKDRMRVNELLYEKIQKSENKNIYISIKDIPKRVWIFGYGSGRTWHSGCDGECLLEVLAGDNNDYIITDLNLNVLATSGSVYPMPEMEGRIGWVGGRLIDLKTKRAYDDIIYNDDSDEDELEFMDLVEKSIDEEESRLEEMYRDLADKTEYPDIDCWLIDMLRGGIFKEYNWTDENPPKSYYCCYDESGMPIVKVYADNSVEALEMSKEWIINNKKYYHGSIDNFHVEKMV